MAAWPDFYLLKCYHREFIDDRPAKRTKPRLIYCNALLEEMNARCWDKLNFRTRLSSDNESQIAYRKIDAMEIVGLWVGWN
jgi:hypothetical protein